MQTFLDLLRAHDIPCSSFQMSSGYTSIGTKRYVFHWNKEKFPSAREFVSAYRQAGLQLAANVKPCLLQDHPMYEECKAAGYFLMDSVNGRGGEHAGSSRECKEEPGCPETSMFWDAVGSHLDFTESRHPLAVVEGAGQGEAARRGHHLDVERQQRVARRRRAGYLPRLRPPDCAPAGAARAGDAHGARVARSPEGARPTLRPWLISRSGMPGMQRYAQTWSGDNYTSWHTLKHNIAMGVGLSLSGFFNTGHDVGGFAGPQPDPELLVRWVQNGVFHPRFTIHSWKHGP